MNNDHKSVYAAAAEVIGMTLALLTDREMSESDVERREQYIDDIVKQLMDKKPDRLITCLHCIQLHFPTIADRLLCSEIHHHLTVSSPAYTAFSCTFLPSLTGCYALKYIIT